MQYDYTEYTLYTVYFAQIKFRQNRAQNNENVCLKRHIASMQNKHNFKCKINTFLLYEEKNSFLCKYDYTKIQSILYIQSYFAEKLLM